MKIESQILVTLLAQSVMKRSKKTLLSLNQFGQLPTVLVNPRSQTGRVVPGIWLGDPQDFTADGTTYRWVTVAHYGLRLAWAGPAADGTENPDA